MAKVKKNVTIDSDLLERTEEYCKRRGIKLSQAISISLSQLVDSERLVQAMVDLTASMRLLAYSGHVDDEDLKRQLDAVTLLCEAMSGKLS